MKVRLKKKGYTGSFTVIYNEKGGLKELTNSMKYQKQFPEKEKVVELFEHFPWHQDSLEEARAFFRIEVMTETKSAPDKTLNAFYASYYGLIRKETGTSPAMDYKQKAGMKKIVEFCKNLSKEFLKDQNCTEEQVSEQAINQWRFICQHWDFIKKHKPFVGRRLQPSEIVSHLSEILQLFRDEYKKQQPPTSTDNQARLDNLYG
ncbi:hypothetical protein [Flammeovirga sp. OC4]|uniref:hypothetical protein n=1 Tax=Flammeovirga sp. OC4 TaxID=1382345 RepID=UPI0005C50080|nr:hypothetical protein [Flammeovirga sp. OC4]